MQSQGNIRVVEMLRYLYQHTDENHPATVTDITAYLKERGIQAVRQTVYADLNALITAGFDIVIVKSTQNQYFMGNRLFEYPELKMLADAVASSKIISAKKSEALVQKLGCLTSIHQAEQLKGLASLGRYKKSPVPITGTRRNSLYSILCYYRLHLPAAEESHRNPWGFPEKQPFCHPGWYFREHHPIFRFSYPCPPYRSGSLGL